MRMELAWRLDQPRPAGTFARLAHEPAIVTRRVQQRAPRLGMAIFGHGLR